MGSKTVAKECVTAPQHRGCIEIRGARQNNLKGIDLDLPLGPVMTVSFPSGRSRSIPLRLFWRAPRISTQPESGGAVTQGFSAVVEPTEDYPIARTRLQIFELNIVAVATALCRRSGAQLVSARAYGD